MRGHERVKQTPVHDRHTQAQKLCFSFSSLFFSPMQRARGTPRQRQTGERDRQERERDRQEREDIALLTSAGKAAQTRVEKVIGGLLLTTANQFHLEETPHDCTPPVGSTPQEVTPGRCTYVQDSLSHTQKICTNLTRNTHTTPQKMSTHIHFLYLPTYTYNGILPQPQMRTRTR